MGIPYGREEIFPLRHDGVNGCIISAHDLQHGIVQNNEVLDMPLGILDIQYPSPQIHIFHEE